MTTPDLTDPKLYINRELSWLAFNRRVLEEAQDETQPLLERLRFLGIVASNLDEFFEVRVAGIKQQIEHDSDDSGPDGMSPRQTFAAIRQDVLGLIDEQYQLWHHELKPALARTRHPSSRLHGTRPGGPEVGLRLFPQRGLPRPHAARRRCQPSLPPSAEQEPQSLPAPEAARAPRPSRSTPSCRFRASCPGSSRSPRRRKASGTTSSSRTSSRPTSTTSSPASRSSRSMASGSPATATSTSTRRRRKTSCAPSRTSCASARRATPCGSRSSTAARPTCAPCCSTSSSSPRRTSISSTAR